MKARAVVRCEPVEHGVRFRVAREVGAALHEASALFRVLRFGGRWMFSWGDYFTVGWLRTQFMSGYENRERG